MSIKSETRIVKDPDIVKTFTSQCTPTLSFPHWGPKQKSIQLLSKGVVRLFEAYTPNSSKDHKTWKAFEHFSARSHDQPHGSDSILFTTDGRCSNYTLDTSEIPDGGCFYNSGIYGPYGQFNTGLSSWYVPRADGGFIPPPTDLELLKNRSLKAMIPNVKADLQALVSLYEMKDILSIKGSIKNVSKWYKAIRHRLSGAKMSKPIGHMTARTGADIYLQGMFNVKPLIQDICGIYHTLTTYQKRLNDLISRSGKLQVARFACNLKEQIGSVYERNPNPQLVTVKGAGTWEYAPGFYYNDRTVTTHSAVFRAHMQFRYYYSAFQRENAFILGLLDAFGVNLNPRIIWQVIPWSFVIDWVFGVGRWLEQFEVKNLEPRINVLQYCWSVKKTRSIITRCIYTANRYYGQGGNHPPSCTYLPQVDETSYRRGIDPPSGSSFTTSGLSPTELSLGAALLITRRRRNTRMEVKSLQKLNTLPF